MTNTPLNPDALEALHNAVEDCGGSYWADVNREEYAEYLVSAYLAVTQPVVNSVEELDALPVGSVIMMRGLGAPFLHTDDGWESTRTPGKPVWDYTNNPDYLPARVLHRP